VTDDGYTPTDEDAPNEGGPWEGERVPPHDLLAEQSVLGAMMLADLVHDIDVVEDVVDRLNPTDFYMPKHENIAKAIVTLHRSRKPTDVIAVTDELNRTGMLRLAGGAEYLHTLTALVPNVAAAGAYAEIVAEKAVMRGLVFVGTHLIQKGYASEGTAEELVEQARTEVDSLLGRRRMIVSSVGETMHELIDDLEHAPDYLPSPWESLNTRIGGFAPGNLHVFAARPGAGKSITLLQCAIQAAHHGAVALSSLEMTTKELQQRLLAQYGGIEMGVLRSRTLTDLDWKLAADARVRLMDAPLFIDASHSVTISHIRSHARAVLRKHGNLSMIAVDYLQLVEGEGREREQVVGNVAKHLKHLAKDLNVPVLAAAQLNRGTPGRGGRTVSPTLRDLRESGGIENNADVVVLMDRPDEKKDLIEFIVAKNRHGAQGKFKLLWQGHFARLRDRQFDPSEGLFPREEAE
jgi:replicative DNA helicase